MDQGKKDTHTVASENGFADTSIPTMISVVSTLASELPLFDHYLGLGREKEATDQDFDASVGKFSFSSSQTLST